jgi:phosphatidylglycerol lysyltransferase
MNVTREKIFNYAKIIFPLVLLVLAALELKKFIAGLNVDLLRNEIGQLHVPKLILILLIAFVAISPMFFYDFIIVKMLGIKVPGKQLVKQSFIANTFSNLIGFGGLAGVMLRTYFYTKYETDKPKLLRTIAYVSLFYLSGISLLCWIIPIGYRDFPLLTEKKWLFVAVLAVCLYLPVLIFVYFFQNKKGINRVVTVQFGVKLLCASFFEWFAIFLIFWLFSMLLSIPISFKDLIPVYIVATCAGIVSMIPGGLGSFDLVFLWGTQNLGIQDEKILVMLLFYRIGYQVLPFLAAFVLFIKEYWDKWNKSWNNLPNALIQSTSHMLLTFMVFASGLILLLSTAVPGIMGRLKIAQEILSIPIMHISHQLTVAAGFVLLGLSRGIEYRVKRAYHLTIAVLSLGALFSIFKGIDYEEAIFLVIVALLLRISKNRFYRKSYVLTWGKSIFDIAVITIFTALFLIIGYSNLPSSKLNIPKRLQPFVITDYRDLFYSALIGLVIAFFILILGYWFRRPKKWAMETSINQEEKVLEHVSKYNGKVLTHLIFLHDKFLYWNKQQNVLFSYQIYADKVVVLGDPIGEKAEWRFAIEEFLDLSDQYGYTPVFYEVSDEMLPFLHEYGYDFFKLGEEAFVDLKRFSLSGKKMKGVRAVKNKLERENYYFEMVKPPFQNSLMNELKEISDQWLQGRKEKGFSLGFFDENYLNRTEIALVKDDDQRIIGFATIMPVYDEHQTISIDLMRFLPDAPAGTMDFIFLSLFEWAKENNYVHFNLGMAPLSNVGLSKFSFLSEKIASQIFLHGQFFYHFQGLRKFKSKYAHFWEPKYLGYRKKTSLPFTMAQITLMIGRKRP